MSIVHRFDTLVDAMTARYGHLPIGLEMACVRLIEEQHAALEKKSDAIQRLWKERDQLRAEVERLREALNEMLDESMDGIAICPLTKIKARNALGRKP